MSVLTAVACAVILGGTFGAGVLLVGRTVPLWSAPSLSRRIAPYVRDVADPQGLTPLVSLAPWRTVRDRLLAKWSGNAALDRRLARAGWRMDAGIFRLRQLAFAVGGVILGAVGVIALALLGRFWAGAVIAPLLVGAAAAIAWDGLLTQAGTRRARRIAEELPTVLEFLALCLAAGESLRDALRRVGEVGSGELTVQLRHAVLLSGTGERLGDALVQVASAADVAPLSRAVDHIAAAIDSGSPLAQVLQAQANDAREEEKRELLEQAGRKEILMLLPLVFLILPLSVLFAIFPGIVMLRVGLG